MTKTGLSLKEFNTTPVAYLCESDLQLETLIKGSKSLSKGNDFVLLIAVEDRFIRRIIPAYINSLIRNTESTKRARSIQMEMLLFISGTMNIGSAIRESGAKSAEKFIAVSNKEALLEEFAKKYHVKKRKQYKLKLNLDVAGDVALTELESEG